MANQNRNKNIIYGKKKNPRFQSKRPGHCIALMPMTDGDRMKHPDIIGMSKSKIGGVWMKCYLVDVPEEWATFPSAYDRELIDEARWAGRCLISGKKGKSIICDHHKSCAGCELAGRLDVQKNTNASIEQMRESGTEPSTSDPDIAALIAKDTADSIIAALERKDKRLANIFRLRLQGIRAAEVGRILEIKKSSLYDQLNVIKEIAVKYL